MNIQPERFQHRRTSGKQLTYDVSVWPDRYSISLNGKMLKEWKRPLMSGNVSDPLQVARVFAISDIEYLVGIAEE